ncbi:uncharacterized protein [Rutidosis leptorrhynchoides]|uniref:uncharacterized protein n=1 Tax=Rutidosis leptorrhynchoides TaxID=125765 RepID=UPI003A992D55
MTNIIGQYVRMVTFLFQRQGIQLTTLFYLRYIQVQGGIKLFQRKLIIFLWRLAIDRLPTRLNLVSRGVDIGNIGCSICNHGVEDNHHIFFSCLLAKEIWRKVSLWTSVDINRFASWSEWLSWYDQWEENISNKNRMYTIVAATVWVIWRFQNGVIFSENPMRKDEIFDSIRNYSYTWLFSRSKKQMSWNSWLVKPL